MELTLKRQKDEHDKARTEPPSLTRRAFLKGTGIAASTGLLVGGKLCEAAAPVLPESKSPRVALQVIVVATRQEAEEILTRLNAGEPFNQVAQERSIDRSAADGGYVG